MNECKTRPLSPTWVPIIGCYPIFADAAYSSGSVRYTFDILPRLNEGRLELAFGDWDVETDLDSIDVLGGTLCTALAAAVIIIADPVWFGGLVEAACLDQLSKQIGQEIEKLLGKKSIQDALQGNAAAVTQMAMHYVSLGLSENRAFLRNNECGFTPKPKALADVARIDKPDKPRFISEVPAVGGARENADTLRMDFLPCLYRAP